MIIRNSLLNSAIKTVINSSTCGFSGSQLISSFQIEDIYVCMCAHVRVYVYLSK